MSEWKEEWFDTKAKEKIYWCFVRPATEEELKPIRQNWEEYNSQQEEDDKILWEDYGDYLERDIMNVLERPKTEEEWKKAVLCIEQDGGREGLICFYENGFEIPIIEDGDDDFSDYTKLRILNLVMLGYVPEETISLMFRNFLTNYYTDNGKITDEEFKKLNKL
jgi:hypothetical protein